MTTKRTVALEDIRCRWGSIRKKASPSVTSLFLASISFATCLATAVLQAWNWNSPSLSSGLTGLLAVVHACKRTASEQVNHYETKTLPVTTRGGPSAGVTSGTPFIGISEPPDKRGQVTTTNVVQGWVRYIIETLAWREVEMPDKTLQWKVPRSAATHWSVTPYFRTFPDIQNSDYSKRESQRNITLCVKLLEVLRRQNLHHVGEAWRKWACERTKIDYSKRTRESQANITSSFSTFLVCIWPEKSVWRVFAGLHPLKAVTECWRVLQSVNEYNIVLQSITDIVQTDCYRV